MRVPLMDTPSASHVRSESTSAPSAAKGSSAIQFVGFRLADVDYAFEIKRIQEIILMRPITRVPQLPPWIEGLINLRGSVIPVVSLRRRFSLETRPIDEETRIIVLNVGTKTVGVVVDSVSRVLKLSSDQIQSPPVTIDAAERAAIQGVARVEDRLVVVLDSDKLLNVETWAVADLPAKID